MVEPEPEIWVPVQASYANNTIFFCFLDQSCYGAAAGAKKIRYPELEPEFEIWVSAPQPWVGRVARMHQSSHHAHQLRITTVKTHANKLCINIENQRKKTNKTIKNWCKQTAGSEGANQPLLKMTVPQRRLLARRRVLTIQPRVVSDWDRSAAATRFSLFSALIVGDHNHARSIAARRRCAARRSGRLYFLFFGRLKHFCLKSNKKNTIYAGFLRCFRDPIRVPRIRENHHRVPRIREIGSLESEKIIIGSLESEKSGRYRPIPGT